jgi:nitrogenase subunit NifH
VSREVDPFKSHVLSTVIRINADIKHAQENQKSIFHYNHSSAGAHDYFKLSEEIIAYDKSRATKGAAVQAA